MVTFKSQGDFSPNDSAFQKQRFSRPVHAEYPSSNSDEVVKLNRKNLKQRLGRDSILNYDSCNLCLSTLQTPVEFEQRLLCKSCLVEHIIAQKQKIEHEKKHSLSLQNNADLERERELANEEYRTQEAFIKANSSLASNVS